MTDSRGKGPTFRKLGVGGVYESTTAPRYTIVLFLRQGTMFSSQFGTWIVRCEGEKIGETGLLNSAKKLAREHFARCAPCA